MLCYTFTKRPLCPFIVTIQYLTNNGSGYDHQRTESLSQFGNEESLTWKTPSENDHETLSSVFFAVFQSSTQQRVIEVNHESGYQRLWGPTMTTWFPDQTMSDHSFTSDHGRCSSVPVPCLQPEHFIYLAFLKACTSQPFCNNIRQRTSKRLQDFSLSVAPHRSTPEQITCHLTRFLLPLSASMTEWTPEWTPGHGQPEQWHYSDPSMCYNLVSESLMCDKSASVVHTVSSLVISCIIWHHMVTLVYVFLAFE